MDIKQLQYFCEIVNSNFNLSLASKKMYISQPTLSQLVNNFESEHGINLFERYKGRFQKLTPAGQNFYVNAQKIIKNYEKMFEDLREDSLKFKGKVRIGVPPLILSLVFSGFFAKMIDENPDIEIEIIEMGANELLKKLKIKELDFAILLYPNELDETFVDVFPLKKDNLSAFMSKKNSLSHLKEIDLTDLDNKKISIFNKTFMINTILMEKFKEKNINPKISVMSGSWSFMFLMTENSQIITILPSFVSDYISNENIVKIPLKEPINWDLGLYSIKKDKYRKIEKYILEKILEYYNEKN